MSDIVVHYFDIYGRAETIRLILHYAGIPFTDHRIQFEEWPAIKATGFTEFGQLPAVDIDGHRLVQTRSIIRYLCQKYNYYVSGIQDVYYVESLCDLIDDIGTYMGKFVYNKDFEGLNKAFEERMPDWLRKLEARLERNNGGQGFFVGDHATKADFYAFGLLHTFIIKIHPEYFDSYAPKVKQWMTRIIESSQTLKTYLDSRPQRDF
ncbi:unnamed protein product [Blepharisma stoltei]|uniref:Glutathione S-transferase n=1 Tax=Blepharisma stoltei TaxID=1481888 RepID=A0AAU9J660_9CILI|nr:unnamed protein product [Blepharisma stoltei]